MKRLLSWVKTFLQGARARLLWSRRCARCQFSFVPISESRHSDLASSRSYLVRDNGDDSASDVTPVVTPADCAHQPDVEGCCHRHNVGQQEHDVRESCHEHDVGECCREHNVEECCREHDVGECCHEQDAGKCCHGGDVEGRCHGHDVGDCCQGNGAGECRCCCDHDVAGEDSDEGDRKRRQRDREGERDRLVVSDDEDEDDYEEVGERVEGSCGAGRRELERLLRTCRRRMKRVTAVSLLWSLLSLLVAGACAFSFYHPNWITHPDRLHSFGLFTQCVRDPHSPHPRALCHGYGPEGRVDLGSIPAGAWQASTLLFGAGASLQCVGAVVTLLLLLLPTHPYGGGGHRLALLCGYMQTLAVLLLVSGLVMFPLGFSTAFFSYYCDSSGAFCVGHCRMGWSYVLAITATALAIFCPVLSNYTDVTFDKEAGEGREAERDLVTDV